MSNIRDYIKIVETMHEAMVNEYSWWPGQPKPAVKPDPNRVEIHAQVPPAVHRPNRFLPKPPPESSIAIHQLSVAAHHQKMGSTAYYDTIVHCATVLRDLASQHGMEQFVPVLNRILKDPDNSAAFIERLVIEFREMEAASKAA
jgi:hypothetical protein